MTGPARTLREDVHIHAPADAVYARITDAEQRWWPPAVVDIDAGRDRIAFTLGLPLRREPVRLLRGADEPPRYLEYVANGEPTAVRGLTWVVNSEGPREVHLIAQLEYQPARGALGWVLEEVLHRPSRRQALRDALWRLKLLIEERQ